VVLFLITGQAPAFLLALLAIMVYLTWYDLREEPLEWQGKLWWALLVLLLNAAGYLAFRAWLARRRHRRREGGATT
jgi:hypothetical protein